MVSLTFKSGCGLSDKNKSIISDFLPFACNRIGIKNNFIVDIMPSDTKGTISNIKDDLKKAVFIPHMRKMEIYVKNRHILDILVSIAHEMVHLKQIENGADVGKGHIPYDIPKDHKGYDIEYEAYGLSGIIVRAYRGLMNEE